jgi:hypothetical protein
MCRRINCVRNDRSSWTLVVVAFFHERDMMPQAPCSPSPPLGLLFFMVARRATRKETGAGPVGPDPTAEVIDLPGIARRAIGHDGDNPAAMVA